MEPGRLGGLPQASLINASLSTSEALATCVGHCPPQPSEFLHWLEDGHTRSFCLWPLVCWEYDLRDAVKTASGVGKSQIKQVQCRLEKKHGALVVTLDCFLSC
jgi:hypothetical protein